MGAETGEETATSGFFFTGVLLPMETVLGVELWGLFISGSTFGESSFLNMLFETVLVTLFGVILLLLGSSVSLLHAAATLAEMTGFVLAMLSFGFVIAVGSILAKFLTVGLDGSVFLSFF